MSRDWRTKMFVKVNKTEIVNTDQIESLSMMPNGRITALRLMSNKGFFVDPDCSEFIKIALAVKQTFDNELPEVR